MPETPMFRGALTGLRTTGEEDNVGSGFTAAHIISGFVEGSVLGQTYASNL